jgi:hypothetical protein
MMMDIALLKTTTAATLTARQMIKDAVVREGHRPRRKES